MTETLLRMIEVGSISIFLYKMTYLTVILCKSDKRRTSSGNYEVFFGSMRPRRLIAMLKYARIFHQ